MRSPRPGAWPHPLRAIVSRGERFLLECGHYVKLPHKSAKRTERMRCTACPPAPPRLDGKEEKRMGRGAL